MMQLLLNDCRVEIDKETEQGTTALGYAIAHRRKIVELLRRHGATVARYKGEDIDESHFPAP
jgi:hypothetical protein